MAQTFPDQWVDTGLCGKEIYSLAASPDYRNDKTIFAGSHGLFMTTNGGLSWQALISPSNNLNPTLALALSPTYATNKTVFAGTSGNGLLVTHDGGSHWESVTGVTNRYISALAAPGNNTILAGTQNNGIFSTTDGGVTWSAVQGMTNPYITSLTAATSNTIFAATLGGGLFKSTDGGANWTALAHNPEWSPGYPQMYITSVAASPKYASDKTVFAGGDNFDGAVWMTQDEGASWRRLHDPWITLLSVTGLAVSQDGTTLFFSTGYDAGSSGVYMTSDFGASWTHMGTSIVGIYDTGAQSLAISADNTLFVGTRTGVWTNAPLNIPLVPPFSQIAAPINGAAIKGTTFAITGTASASCPYLVRKVELSINGGSWLGATGTTSWNYVWSLPSDGRYLIRSRTTDSAGNQEAVSSGIAVTVDNTKPRSTVTNVNWSTTNGIRYLSIYGTATDGAGSGVARVDVGFSGLSSTRITLPRGRTVPSRNDRPIWTGATGTSHWYFRMRVPLSSTIRRGIQFRIQSRATDGAGNIEIPRAGKVITIP
jgi:photosystem II stability/assembly factor-like uncharacterized protein